MTSLVPQAGQARDLGICDASPLLRLGVKGTGAVAWLQAHVEDVVVPDATYGVASIAGGGQVVRAGRDEVFLEDGWGGHLVPGLEKALRSATTDGPYEIVRQDASFLLSGARAPEVLAQTCGVDFRDPAAHPGLVMSRVAGVSAAIRFRSDLAVSAFQLWIDPSYGSYLWHTLSEIVADLGGHQVARSCFWPSVPVPDRNPNERTS